MPRKNRNGQRQPRRVGGRARIPELGYYLIVTDTEATERCFFEGLKAALPEEIQGKLVVKVKETETGNLIDLCQQLVSVDPQYRMGWIVFDRDQVKNFDKIIEEAKDKRIHAAWSNPCFEIWMFGYYGKMPNIQTSWDCCDEFGREFEKRTGIRYSKADKTLYKRLKTTGNEEDAIKIADRKYTQCISKGNKIPSTMCPCTTVHMLVKEIQEKAENH